MKKIENNKWLYTLFLAITTSIFGMILYPLFDYLLAKFITHSTFVYSVEQHIISPIIFGFVVSIVLYFINNKKDK